MDFTVSKDRRYIQLESMVVDLETGLKFDVNHAHPAVVCEMFKNQFTHSYKYQLMESKQLFSKMKKLIYPLIEHDKNIVSEYEVRYGMNLIFESSDTFNYSTYKTIEESWDYIKTKMLDVCPVTPSELLEGWLDDTWGAIKSGASAVWDKVKQAGSWILNKGLPWFFEKLESFLLNPVTIGFEVALSTIGVGKVAGAILWGALGIWKIYQLFTGKISNDIWSYLDIGVCLLGLLLTGGAAKALKAAIKGTGRSIAKLAKLPGIKQLIQVLSKGISFISSAILKPIEWLAKNLGGSKVTEMINVAKNKISEVVKKLQNTFSKAAEGPGLGKTTVQGVKTDIINPARTAFKTKSLADLERAAFKGAATGTAFAVGMKGVEKYAEKRAKQDEEKLKQEKAKADQAIAQYASNDETLKQAAQSDMQALINKFKEMDNQK
jgi:hypothetical protein